MRLLFFVILITAISIHQGFCQSDKIIVRVNKDAITSSEAQANLNVAILELSQAYEGRELQEKIKEAKKHLIERMVEDKLILQEAKRLGYAARPEAVKKRIEQIKRGFPEGLDFEEGLMERGLNLGDFEKRLNEQFIMREVIEREIKGKIIINPEEVTKYYHTHKEEFSSPQKRQIEMFFSKDEQNLSLIAKDLKNGISPLDTAKKYGVQYMKETLEKNNLRKEFADIAYSMKENEVCRPIFVDSAYYVIRILQIIEPKTLKLNEVQDRIHEAIFQEKFSRKFSEWIQGLKGKAYIYIKDES